jgi:hypothetical protein
VGAAALVVGPVVGKPEPAAAASPNPPKPWFLIDRKCVQISFNPPLYYCYNIYEADVGQITIGGLLVTYVSAPLSARGNLTYSLSRTRSETMRVITEDSRELTTSLTLGPFTTSNKLFTVNGSFERVQGTSTKVTNAITHSSTATQSLQTAPVAGGGYNAWENTAFLVMARPVMAISSLYNGYFDPGNPDGETLVPVPTPDGQPVFRYRFVNGGTIFPRSARELRDDPGTRDFIGPETADAILAEYPLRPDQTSGVQLGLGGPRFGPPTAIAPGEVPFSFTQSMTGSNTHSEEQTRRVMTTIKSGFSVNGIVKFEASRRFTSVHTSVQETTNTEVMSTSGLLTSNLNHLNHVYEDRVWNTLLITDEGPLVGAFDAVSGVVTAEDGTAVDGAVLTMLVGGVTHETVADRGGRYTFRLGRDVEPGQYRVSCAGLARTVTVSAGKTATANYRGVSSGLARARTR